MSRKSSSGLLISLVLVSFTLSGCGTYRGNTRFTDVCPTENSAPASVNTINIRFLGTGGILLEGEDITLLGDPFFTNSAFWNIISPFPTESDTVLIDKVLSPLLANRSLQTILITHAHYDHAMDLPHIIKNYRPQHVYGSETLGKLLGNVGEGVFEDVASDTLARDGDGLRWIHASPRVRIAAIKSEHFPHVGHWTYADGTDGKSSTHPPSRLCEWQSGNTYSFLIDILPGAMSDEPKFRIFYMPSAATHPTGTPPVAAIQKKSIDVAILGAAQLGRDDNYPTQLLSSIKPSAIIYVHWDNFVDQYRSTRAMNFMVSPEQLAQRTTQGVGETIPAYWPFRGAVMNFSLNSAQGGADAETRRCAEHESH